MADSEGLRKPLHPFVKFVAIVAVIIIALDLATGVLSFDKSVSGTQMARDPMFMADFGINLAHLILLHVAYLIGLGVVIELVDRILWRLTPEADRRVGRSRRSA